MLEVLAFPLLKALVLDVEFRARHLVTPYISMDGSYIVTWPMLDSNPWTQSHFPGRGCVNLRVAYGRFECLIRRYLTNNWDVVRETYPASQSSIRDRGLCGQVGVRFVIDENGMARNPQVVFSGSPQLALATTDLVKRWKFSDSPSVEKSDQAEPWAATITFDCEYLSITPSDGPCRLKSEPTLEYHSMWKGLVCREPERYLER